MREIAADQRQALESARTRERAAKLQHELPSLIQDRVGEHISKLENKLLSDFREMGQRAIDQSTAVLNDQLGGRIDTLEQISSIQTKTIGNLRDSSRVAEQKVSSVVTSIENTLSAAVPGFRLEESKFANAQSEATSPFIADEEREEDFSGKYGFCPNCTSTNVRRAYRKGLWEEMLRLFFLAPYRCRACRHKFYRF
ncbi:MAG: hypothetical protein M3N93_07590 [Acidobacteriota bacterium]|nr:hypothetical protein [Acidobacteriota bacterium]